MHRLASFAFAVAIAAPVMAGDALEHLDYRTFRQATRDLSLSGWRLSYDLWRCNRTASRLIAERPVVERILRSLDDEATEAMASCKAEVDALAREAPAGDVAALQAAIVQANAEAITNARKPQSVLCASHPCGTPLGR